MNFRNLSILPAKRFVQHFPTPQFFTLAHLCALAMIFGLCRSAQAYTNFDFKAGGRPFSHSIGRSAGWKSPGWAGNAGLEPLGSSGVRITLPGARPWAAAIDSTSVDVDATPILAITVSDLSPGASWVVKLGDAPYDVAKPSDLITDPAGGVSPGLFLVDLREISGAKWRGRMNLEVRLFVVSNRGSGAVTFSDVRLLPALSPHADDSSAQPSSGDALQVSSGPWTLGYVPDEKKLRLRRSGSTDSSAGLSISLPGFTEAARASRGTANIQFFPVKAVPGQNVRIFHCTTDEAVYEVRFTAYSNHSKGSDAANTPVPGSEPAALFRWTVTATWRKPHAVFPSVYQNQASPECSYRSTASGGLPTCVLSKHRFGQVGPETGQAFLPCDPIIAGSALYVQNLTALSPYFEATHSSAAKTVWAVPEGFGFRPNPTTAEATGGVVPAGTALMLADSFLALSTGGPTDAAAPTDAARVYLHLLATVYDALPDQPTTMETDWHVLAEQTLKDIVSPSCWSSAEHGYLRNYINEPWPPTTGELTVQLYPLLASLLYDKAWGLPPDILTTRIAPTLPDFYLADIRSIHDFTSETHPTTSDSGALIGPLVQLAKAAELGVPSAKRMCARFARHRNRTCAQMRLRISRVLQYADPRRLQWGGAGRLRRVRLPDASGACAVQRRSSLLDRRELPLPISRHMGLRQAYESPTSAYSAVACAWMWKLTGDRSYLALSLVPLANVLRNCWLYEPGYGFQKQSHLFFTVSAMPGAYTAPIEQYQVWLAMREYDDLAHDELPYDARLLVSELLKYGQTNLRSMYPIFMPSGSVAAINDRHSPSELGLMVPVEDLNDGWAVSGRIGQEIYGVGARLQLADVAYDRVPEAGIWIHSEYPVRVKVWNVQKHILRLHFGGVCLWHGSWRCCRASHNSCSHTL